MPLSYRLLLLVFFWCGAISGCLGQGAAGGLVSGNFDNIGFRKFVAEVEAQTAYKFYYDNSDLDTLVVSLQVQQQPLEEVLRQVLVDSVHKFSVTERQEVFITRGREFQARLPENYFEQSADVSDATLPAAVAAYMEQEAAPKKATSDLKLYEIGIKSERSPARATLAGHLRDPKSGEPVIGAYVYIESPLIGTSSDQYGYYAITVPTGRHVFIVKGIGYKNTRRQVLLHSDGKLDIEVEEDVRSLKEVLVEAEKDRNVTGLQMGMERLDIRTLKQVPTAFGETDVLRVVLTLPGVKSVGEGSTGMNVRGGSTDQNLILFNDATIYNPSHLFGFFSAFNPDILKTVELYKSAVPAKYGGRLSSVLEITTREGNKKKLVGSGGIGLLTGRLALEGPLVKDKSSFLLSGRSTYSNWLLRQLPGSTFNQSSASFYDMNAQITHQFDSKNTLYISGYTSKDKFKLTSDTLYSFSNYNASVKWKHIFQNKLYGVLTGAYSHYDYAITSERNPVIASTLGFDLNQANLQADFSYFPASKHTVDFGASSILYNVAGGSQTPIGPESLVMPDRLQREKAVESALYISDRYDINRRLSVSVGLRYSFFNAMGPRSVLNYVPGVPRTEYTVIDTSYFGSGDVSASYHGPEYRLSARLGLTDNSSLKISYNRQRQYIHMLSNTAAISPADIWKLSDANIRPQVGDQYAIGYYRNFRANTVEFSLEGYTRTMQDFLDYKNGAMLVMNHQIEQDVVNAEGKAYGVEVMLKKLSGKLNGWVSYTYSRSLVRVNNETVSEIINKGNFYPSNFDKPHDVTMVGNFRFSQRISASLNLTYSTGRPITLPIAKYYDNGVQRVYYSDRNAYRVPDYYRADFALNLEGNHKVRKLAHSSWTLAVYNLTGRRNPYSIYFRSENGRINGYKLSIFGQPIPTITYNFRF